MFPPFLKLFSFTQFQNRSQRLSMNLLVKNEVDVIADNIRFHATQGVDCFVVMDNGSTDGTLEAVEALQGELEIHIIRRPVQDYQQSNWKSEMAFVSRDLLKADWSIANDADEFWVTDSGDLKASLTNWGSILACPRYNMIPDQAFHLPDFHYLNSPYRVKLPIFNKGADIINDDQLSIMLGKINGKVMVNNHGLLRVKGGNHRAWHTRSFINQRSEASIGVYHYPIRSKAHFIEHIENREKLLASGVTKMGDHYRRWVRQYQQGKLDSEFSRLVIQPEDAEVLKRFGVLKDDLNVGAKIRAALVESSNSTGTKS